ncbi:hypothetical protein [Pseudomonas oryzihabitans]|uniref:Uncharacterized protein n=1 Tax=Pseudomonas oryzihabitans TaxID=47885 RepID=A0AAJ2BGU7_9PSED|nr:hypothetical protein [Pseudomonas psychrotolerans]MDR6234033.1 hypothetical protein [Pseudomonas psychrotolerans]MDR6356871.1 hypothetical protein [Pseudomonas psychrotolerans]
MNPQAQEAAMVLAQLKRWRDEAIALMEEAPKGGNIESLQGRLARLKDEIRAAAKHETLSGKKQDRSEIEQSFFGPCVRSTIANFRIRTDTSPKSPAWSKGLAEVEFELHYVIDRMERVSW